MRKRQKEEITQRPPVMVAFCAIIKQMASKQLIPHITPTMFSGQIDQVCATLNRIIDDVNDLKRES